MEGLGPETGNNPEDVPRDKISKFELINEERGPESAKENFLSFMEAVWPTVAQYYLQVEQEILASIKKADSKKIMILEGDTTEKSTISGDLVTRSAADGGDKEKGYQQQGQLGAQAGTLNTSSEISPYDPSVSRQKLIRMVKGEDGVALPKQQKIVQLIDGDGKIIWDVVSAASLSLSPEAGSVPRVDSTIPIVVHNNDPSRFYSDVPDKIPEEVRKCIIDAEAAVRQALSQCFGKISKSFTNCYPRIRLAISKSYPQIRHTVSCSYPNIQYTINNAYEKVQGTVKLSYPRIRKTVVGSYPKRQVISSCFRRVRQIQSRGQNKVYCLDTNNPAVNKNLVDANVELMSRLAGSNAEISQALHNTSKKISIALGTANLEILQSIKNASHKVSKSLIKANSEILETLAMTNDDLQKSTSLACNEAARTLETVKVELSKTLLELHPKVWQVVRQSYDNLQAALEQSLVEILETLSVVSSEVCEQISSSHGKYSENKVNVNYELSLALAKANSQVLQILIGANSKISDILDKNTEKVAHITSRVGSSLEVYESRIWRIVEKGEADIWKMTESACFTTESAIESIDTRLWKVADDADNCLRKAVPLVEQRLLGVTGSAEWKLKKCAERLEAHVTECVASLVQNLWQTVSFYLAESETVRRMSSRNYSSIILTNKNSSSSSEMVVKLNYNNSAYYVGFPDSDADEDMDTSILRPTTKALNAQEGWGTSESQSESASDSAAVDVTSTDEGQLMVLDLATHSVDIPSLGACEGVLNLYTKQENNFENSSVTSLDSCSTDYQRASEDVQSTPMTPDLSTLLESSDCISQALSEIKVELGPKTEHVKEKEYSLRADDETQAVKNEDVKLDIASGGDSLPNPKEEMEVYNAGSVPEELPEKVGGNLEQEIPSLRTVAASSNIHSSDTVEQLSAQFRANLEKIQLSISDTVSEETCLGPESSPQMQAQKLLQECQQAWDMLTSLIQAGESKPCKPRRSRESLEFSGASSPKREQMETSEVRLEFQSSGTTMSTTEDGVPWVDDVIFTNIRWEAVESSTENLALEEHCQNSGSEDNCFEEATTTEKPEATNCATSGSSMSTVDVDSAVKKELDHSSELIEGEQESSLPMEISFYCSENDDDDSSSTTVSPPASVNTLPFTDDEQNNCRTYSPLSAAGSTSATSSEMPQTDNIREMLSNFVELSTVLFYQASCKIMEQGWYPHDSDDDEREHNFQHLHNSRPVFMSAVEITPSLLQQPSLPDIPDENNNPSTPPVPTNNIKAIPSRKSPVFIGIPSSPSKIHSFNKHRHKYVLQSKTLFRKIGTSFSKRKRRWKYSWKLHHLKKILFPCFQNNLQSQTLYPIKRVQKCTNLLL